MERGRAITVCEVGPRDGLQNEPGGLSLDQRVEFIDRLSSCGFPRIEAVSFVNPRRVPQMAHAEEVMGRIRRRAGTVYAGLVLNARGAERALAAGVDEMHFSLLASDSFNRRNQGCSPSDSLEEFARIVPLAERAGVRCTVTVGAAFGCPFEGTVPVAVVLDLAERAWRAGAAEVVLADTIGIGVPSQVTDLVHGVRQRIGRGVPIGCHFHNTRNTGLANAYAALVAGVEVMDSSVGGIGGCPFAPAATGNIPTEDLLYMLRGSAQVGVSLAGVIDVARWLQERLGHPLPAMVSKAGAFPPAVIGSFASEPDS